MPSFSQPESVSCSPTYSSGVYRLMGSSTSAIRWKAAALPFFSSAPATGEIFAVEPIKQHRERDFKSKFPDEMVVGSRLLAPNG